MRPEVAERAVRAGARMINDVSGGRAEPEMLPTVARLGVPYVCMHWRGHATDMQSRASYADLAAEVVAELAEQVEAALAAGIRRDRLALDPGFGFAKTGEHNWELLNRLDELDALGLPILYGLSRKTFLGSLLAAPDGTPRPARRARRRLAGPDHAAGLAAGLGGAGAPRTADGRRGGRGGTAAAGLTRLDRRLGSILRSAGAGCGSAGNSILRSQ